MQIWGVLVAVAVAVAVAFIEETFRSDNDNDYDYQIRTWEAGTRLQLVAVLSPPNEGYTGWYVRVLNQSRV